MSRFRDVRTTHFKRVVGDEPNRSASATPRMLSPFERGGIKLRRGVKHADVLQPLHNRRSRRAAGQTKSRHRIGGVALINKPWNTNTEGTKAA